MKKDVRKLLKKLQRICRAYEVEWAYVQHDGFTMVVEPDIDIERLATVFEEWKKQNENE